MEPSQTVELRTAVDGLIDKVLVQRADRVRSGQTLVVLQSSVEQVAVASAQFRAGMQGQISTTQSRLQLAKAKFDRADQLQRERLVTAQAADEARAELGLAQAETGARHCATVQRVDAVIDAARGTFVARLALPNADGRLPSGMRCLARFDPPLAVPARPAAPA